MFTFSIVNTGCKQKKEPTSFEKSPQGTAVIITGAAARIPQEAALLEELFNKGELNDVAFISGASSGALNTVILNAILSKKLTWEKYRSWLDDVSTNDIYTKLSDRKLPVDVAPLRKFLKRIVNDSLGYYKIGDLPIPSSISITDVNLLKLPKKNFRLSNLKINSESDPSLDLVEVLMASTAFPIVFPEEKINNAPTLPDDYFVDGGIGEDHIPYTALIEFINYRKQSVKKVIIVSRKSDLEPDLSDELKTLGITDRGVFDRAGISIDEFLYKGFIKSMNTLQQEYPKIAEKTVIYVPNFKEKFLLLDFNTLKQQYETASKWALCNNPVPLETYLAENKDIIDSFPLLDINFKRLLFNSER